MGTSENKPEKEVILGEGGRRFTPEEVAARAREIMKQPGGGAEGAHIGSENSSEFPGSPKLDEK